MGMEVPMVLSRTGGHLGGCEGTEGLHLGCSVVMTRVVCSCSLADKYEN